MERAMSVPARIWAAFRADVMKPKVGGRNVLMSTTHERHAERVRTCFAKKAMTDPLEKRDRRRTELMALSSRHRAATMECHGSIGSVRPSSPVYTAITRGNRLTLTCKPLMLPHTQAWSSHSKAQSRNNDRRVLWPQGQGSCLANIDPISHDSERCAVTLKCSVLRCGLN